MHLSLAFLIRYYVVSVYSSLYGMVAICQYFDALYPGALSGFLVVTKNNSDGGLRVVVSRTTGKQMISALCQKRHNVLMHTKAMKFSCRALKLNKFFTGKGETPLSCLIQRGLMALSLRTYRHQPNLPSIFIKVM